MSSRNGVLIWLIVGLGFGLLTLGCCGGGGYALWYTHGEAVAAEKRFEEDDIERKKPALTKKEMQRQAELEEKHKVNVDKINQANRHRQYAIAFLVACLIPGLVSVRCLFTAIYRMLKTKKSDDDSEEPPRKRPGRKKPPRESSTDIEPDA